jgi:hypothetical protein
LKATRFFSFIPVSNSILSLLLGLWNCGQAPLVQAPCAATRSVIHQAQQIHSSAAASIGDKASTSMTWIPILVLMRLELGIRGFSLKATTAIPTFDSVFDGKWIRASIDPPSCAANMSGSPLGCPKSPSK